MTRSNIRPTPATSTLYTYVRQHDVSISKKNLRFVQDTLMDFCEKACNDITILTRLRQAKTISVADVQTFSNLVLPPV